MIHILSCQVYGLKRAHTFLPVPTTASMHSKQSHFVKITMKGKMKNMKNNQEDCEKSFKLCGMKAICDRRKGDRSRENNGQDENASLKSSNLQIQQKRTERQFSLPSISTMSSVSTDSARSAHDITMHVTPFYDTDFGYHSERLVPHTGMSQHKSPPTGLQRLQTELAQAAKKHIYSLQIFSSHHRGSRRQESVHNLMSTIAPSSRERTFVRAGRSLSGPPPSKATYLEKSNPKLELIGVGNKSLTTSRFGLPVNQRHSPRLIGLSKLNLQENLPPIDVNGNTVTPRTREGDILRT